MVRGRRLETMRRAQAAALGLFEALGYDAVTIEQVARAIGVGPATLYRAFGEKPRLVLWDDYDPLLVARFEAALTRGTDVLEAARTALASALGEVYATDKARILRRARLIQATPALQAAQANDVLALRDALSVVLVSTGRARSALEATVVAGTLASALEAAARAWVADGGARPLTEFLDEALGVVRSLGGRNEDARPETTGARASGRRRAKA